MPSLASLIFRSLMANKTGLRLIVLDDGGPRAALQLIVLHEFMKRVSSTRRGGLEIKPYKYFDLIVGTGTGGLVTVMLVKLRMSVEETIKEFDKICKEVYMKTDHTPAERTSKLRECIEDLLSRKKVPIDAKMRDETDENFCRSFVVARPLSNPSGTTKIRNYAIRNEVSPNMTIIEAVLATCAIEPAFLPVTVASIGELVGGGLGINLTDEVLKDIQLLFGGEATIGSLVSLGAGHPSPNSLSNDGYSRFMERILSENEENAKKAEQQLGPLGFYFRFSSPQEVRSGSELNSQVIASFASAYVAEPSISSKLDQCAMVLESQLGLVAVDQLLGTFSTRKSLKGLPSLTMHFVMRDEPWKELTRGLIKTEEQPLNQNIVIVSGMGGCGKTQLAIKFAKEHKSMYDYVFWVDGSSEATIKADLTSHVRSLGGDHSQTDWAGTLEFLASHITPWLIVYDNVDDINIKVTGLIPSCDHGSVIITTRNRALGQLVSEVHLELDVMTQDEANETILRSAKMKTTDKNRQEIRPVAEALGLLPVALVQAGSYMFQTKCSPGEYISLLQHNRSELLELPAAAQRDIQHRSAYTAFDVSYQALPSDIQKFLHLLSFYHHANFPLAMIPHAAKQAFKTVHYNFFDNKTSFDSAVRLLDEIFCPSGVWEDTTLHKMLMILQNYSFAAFGPRITTLVLRMHPLIHSFCFDRLPIAEQEIFSAAAVRLMGCWGEGGVENLKIQNAAYEWGLTRHMEAVFPHVKEISINDRATIATILAEYKNNVQPVLIWEDILEMLQEKYGPVNLHVAEVYMQLGSAYVPDFPKACEAYAQSAYIREQLLGPCHEETLNARIQLAEMHTIVGNYGVAEKMLETLQVDTPQNSAFIPGLREELGIMYNRRGQYAKAMVIQLQQLQFMKEQHGDTYLGTICAMGHLAETCRLLGRYSEAEELLLRIKDIEEAKPQGSKRVTGYQHILPIVYRAQGQYDKAEAISTHHINLVKQISNSNSSPSILYYVRSVQSRGETYYCQGRYAEAEQDCLHALSIWDEKFGPNHPGKLQPTNTLGRVYHALGRYSEAEALQLEMVERRLKLHEGLHPHAFEAYADLAATHAAQGRLDEAKERQEWVLEQQKEWLGESHPDTGSTMYELATTYQRLGRIREARDLAMKAESIHGAALGTNHPKYQKTSDLLKELQNWHASFGYYGALIVPFWKRLRLKEAMFILILAVLVYFARFAW